MTIRSRNDLDLFKVQIENNSFLAAGNCRQATILKDKKIFILENMSYRDVLQRLEKTEFEIVNIY